MRYHDTAMPRRRTPNQTSPPTDRRYEVELITGLERFVDDELAETLGKRAYRLAGYPKEGRMSFRYPGPVERLMALRSAVAVHLVERFDIPRPKALLGHQHFSRLVTAIRTAIGLHPAGTFKTFRVSAAGTESTTMRRLRTEIGAAIRLDEQTDEAHLNLSVRRSVSGGGWEALVRLTPMPLSARKWRVCNRPDALNATVAHAMIALPDHSETDRFLNIGCGSGTLLVERLAAGPAASVIGLDLDPEAISCSERNLKRGRCAARSRSHPRRHSTPRPCRTLPFDTAVADLPFGMLANTDAGLDKLYEAALRETARLVVQGRGLHRHHRSPSAVRGHARCDTPTAMEAHGGSPLADILPSRLHRPEHLSAAKDVDCHFLGGGADVSSSVQMWALSAVVTGIRRDTSSPTVAIWCRNPRGVKTISPAFACSFGLPSPTSKSSSPPPITHHSSKSKCQWALLTSPGRSRIRYIVLRSSSMIVKRRWSDPASNSLVRVRIMFGGSLPMSESSRF